MFFHHSCQDKTIIDSKNLDKIIVDFFNFSSCHVIYFFVWVSEFLLSDHSKNLDRLLSQYQ